MSAIAAYRTAILALVSDPGLTYFTTDDVDTALRWALSEYSRKRPLIRTYMFTVVSTTTIHSLPADFISRHIIQVELYDADPDLIVPVPFYAYYRDEDWFIQTMAAVQGGEVLQISYSDIHQVDGLDGAAGTTIPDADETLLQVGAAGHALLMLPRTVL